MYKKYGLGRNSDACIHALDVFIDSQSGNAINAKVAEYTDCKIWAPVLRASRQHVQVTGTLAAQGQSHEFLVGLLRATLACHMGGSGSDPPSVSPCEPGTRFGTGFVVLHRDKKQPWLVHTRILNGTPYILNDIYKESPTSSAVTRHLLCASKPTPHRSARMIQTSQGRWYSVETQRLDVESSELLTFSSVAEVTCVACTCRANYGQFRAAFVQANVILRECANALEIIRRRNRRALWAHDV